MKILRIAGVVKMLGFKSRTSLYSQIKDGLFTRPVAIGPRAVGIPEHEVHALLRLRIKGGDNEALKSLVHELHIAREQARPAVAVMDVAS
jgi:prophage regulatory protein